MAHEHDHHSVKVIEKCQVSPPPGSVPLTSLPLSFFDILWFYCHPIQRILFYEFPYPTQSFMQTALPTLKHSLSLTLQHFFPFAANLIYPPKPHIPYILYLDGNSIPFTIAEYTADFNHLVSNSPKNVTDLHPFVPVLPSPRTLEDGTRSIPLMAIQVTVLPYSGFAICITFNHVAGDGRAFHHFLKFWSSVCGKKGDLTCLQGSLPLPLHNRDIIPDPKGIKLIHLEDIWSSAPQRMEFASPARDVFTDKVRATFVLSRDQIEGLKKWISVKCSSDHLGTLHASTFVVTSSLIWVCLVKSEETMVDNIPNNDELYHLIFLADCSNRPEFLVPSTYFGNCLAYRIVTFKRSDLVGENAIVEAAKAIESQVRDVQSDPLKGLDTMLSDFRERVKSGHFVVIAGSPKLGVYETDFGWGKPKKSEIAHIDFSKSIALSDCRNKEGGIEVGLALGRIQMNNFTTILKKHLSDIVGGEL